MTISKMVLKVILVSAVLALPACLKGPGFFKQEAATISYNGNIAPVKSDQEGVLTATISANSGSAQIVGASQSSAISSAQVTFPSGALALDTNVTIEEGSSIAGSAFASELGVDDLQVASAGTPVVVQSSVPMDAASPFTLAIPVTTSSGLRLTDDDSLIIVIYKVYKAAEGKVVAGIIPNNDLTITNGIVSFDTSHFGVYQAAVADRPVEKKIEAETKAPILTKSEEKKLAEIVWQPVTVRYTATSRKLLVSTSAENLSATRCSIFYDQDKKEPWEHVEKTTGKLTFEILVPNDVNGTFFAIYECLDQSGRISRSLWSKGVAIKAVTQPAKPTQTTGGDSDSTSIAFVTSVMPNPNATDVKYVDPIIIKFSEKIYPQGESTNKFTLKENNSGRFIPGTLTVTGNIATFRPQSGRLPLAASFTANFPSAFGNGAGKPNTPFTWSFKTLDGGWKDASDSLGSGDSKSSTDMWKSIGPNGSVLLVTRESCNTHYCYKGAYSKDGSDWSKGFTPLGEFFDNVEMRILIDKFGTAGVVFSYFDWAKNIQHINIVKYDFSADAWSSIPEATFLTSTQYSLVAITTNDVDNMSAIFTHYETGSGNTYYAAHLNKGTWSISLTDPLFSTSDFSPTIINGPNGALLATFVENNVVKIALSRNGYEWDDTIQEIASFSGSSAEIKPMFDANGGASVLVIPTSSQDNTSAPYKIFLSKLTPDSTTWQNKPSIFDLPSQPTLVYSDIDSSGNTSVIFKVSDSISGRDNYSSLKHINGEWAPNSTPINTDSQPYFTSNSKNSIGTIVMTVNDNCTTDAATHRCIKVAHSNPDGSWTDLPNILNPPNPIFIAFPLIDAADNISVIFIPQSSSESEIFASRYSPITKTWDDAPKSIYSKNNNNNTTMTFGDFDAELAQDGSIRIIWTESDGTNYFFKTLNFD